MWLRYRNRLSGHEASLPVEVGPHLPDWEPVDDAEPSEDFQEPTYTEVNAEPQELPVEDAKVGE